MTLVRRNDLFPELPSLFDDFLTRDFWKSTNGGWKDTMPAVNIEENENEFSIEVAAPGYKKGDFKIELDNNMLTIASEKQMEDNKKEKNYTRKEFHYESFSRSFRLPENVVNGDKITANYDDGVLHIHLPKREEVKPKPTRLISIK